MRLKQYCRRMYCMSKHTHSRHCSDAISLQIATFLNFVAVAYNSSTALPFGTVVIILLILTLGMSRDSIQNQKLCVYVFVCIVCMCVCVYVWVLTVRSAGVLSFFRVCRCVLFPNMNLVFLIWSCIFTQGNEFSGRNTTKRVKMIR